MNRYRFEPEEELTTATDIVTGCGTVRLIWLDEDLVRVRVGPFEPAERRPAIRRYVPTHEDGQRLVAQFLSYFQGKETVFQPPLSRRLGTEFQRRVWQALKQIPYGQCETYTQLAVRVGLPESNARAVANACGQNPLPIVLPCHRVVASTGVLTGYSAGIPWKKALLELEGVPIENARVRLPQQRPS